MTTAWKAQQQGPAFWKPPVSLVAKPDSLGDVNSTFETGHNWSAPAGITITIEEDGGPSGRYLRFTNTSGGVLTADVECLYEMPVDPTFWRGQGTTGPLLDPRFDVRASGALPTGVSIVFRFLDAGGALTFGPATPNIAVTNDWAPHLTGAAPGFRFATPLSATTTRMRLALRLNALPAGASVDIDNYRMLSPRSNGRASLAVAVVHMEAHTRLNSRASSHFDLGPVDAALGTGGGPTLSTADPYAGDGALRATAGASAWDFYTAGQMLATSYWPRLRVRFAARKTGGHTITFRAYSNGEVVGSTPGVASVTLDPQPARRLRYARKIAGVFVDVIPKVLLGGVWKLGGVRSRAAGSWSDGEWTVYDFTMAPAADPLIRRYDFGFAGSGAGLAAGDTLDVDSLLVVPVQSNGVADLTVV